MAVYVNRTQVIVKNINCRIYPKYWDRHARANEVDEDQTAPKSVRLLSVNTVQSPRCPHDITKARLKPHFYIVKQGFTGVYIIFLFC